MAPGVLLRAGGSPGRPHRAENGLCIYLGRYCFVDLRRARGAGIFTMAGFSDLSGESARHLLETNSAVVGTTTFQRGLAISSAGRSGELARLGFDFGRPGGKVTLQSRLITLATETASGTFAEPSEYIMRCPHCDKTISQIDKFCRHCGKPVVAPPPPAPPRPLPGHIRIPIEENDFGPAEILASHSGLT